MSDTDQETIENIREWWRENGRFVVLGVVVGVGGLVGWNQWNAWQTRTAEEASRVYVQMVNAVDGRRRNEARELAGRLAQEYPRTPYADQAGLIMAQVHMDNGDAAAAADELRTVAERTRDRELRAITRLRLARVLHHKGDLDDALAVLDGVSAEGFAARRLEIRGDILSDAGDVAGARSAYEAALAHPERGLIDVNLVRIKLDDLPRAVADNGGAS